MFERASSADNLNTVNNPRLVLKYCNWFPCSPIFLLIGSEMDKKNHYSEYSQ